MWWTTRSSSSTDTWRDGHKSERQELCTVLHVSHASKCGCTRQRHPLSGHQNLKHMSDALRPCPGGKSILKRGGGNLYSLGELCCAMVRPTNPPFGLRSAVNLPKLMASMSSSGTSALVSAVATSTNATVAKGQCNKTFPKDLHLHLAGSPQILAQSLRRQIELHLRSMIDQLWRQGLCRFSWPSFWPKLDGSTPEDIPIRWRLQDQIQSP